MIWKAMFEEPFFLHIVPYDWEKADRLITTRATAGPRSYLETTCYSFHQAPAHSDDPSLDAIESAHPSPHGALSWLRTCRLIYTEAKPLPKDKDISLHVCDIFTFVAAVDGRTPSLPLSQVRSMSFCMKMDVEDVFYAQNLPALQALTIFAHFECLPFQGNDRLGDGPEDPAPRLRRVDCPWIISYVRPYSLLQALTRTVSMGDVKLDLAGVRHNPWNRCPNVGDRCWCRGRSIDESSVPVEQIKLHLMAGIWKVSIKRD
ncbi:hypothetical protein P170DRAFT_476415 [Aspergillus steynii IBT 23096]|uniref:Uncharacterized protein n=1 Tax=Aspergillus steynii IBT 23096 TaxID=1392250 RepID=A0A2I2G4E6_9EURO|nr:uncharacterized protein P170DRAFT_476415 [Aspergillus steynii IBT 23096]PLB47739.1 hypothetical protein P170DRAFT_476415 [Aspergillus steynii IBT 23096]